MCGLFFASFFAPLTSLISICVIAVVFTIYVLIKKERRVYLYVIVISFCIAAFYSAVYSYIVYSPLQKLCGKEVTLSGKVAESKQLFGGKSRITVKGDIDGKKAIVIVYADTSEVKTNDTFEAQIKPQPLTESLSFFEKSYYKAKGIYLKSSECKNIKITQSNCFSITASINTYRDYISKRVVSILPGEEGNFIKSILCGKKDGLQKSTQSNLFRAGIGHITSVSGTHLMIISALLYIILNALPIGKKPKFIILEVFIIGYAVFSGFCVSVLRSAVMFTIVLSADVLKRRADVLNSLGIAGIVLTISNPFSIRDASFLLSFAGVLGIAVVAPIVNRTLSFKGKLKKLKSSFVAMVCVSITTLPFVIMFFDELSLISPFSNIILAPLYSVILICGFIVVLTGGVAFLAYPLLFIAGLFTKLLLFICKMIVKIPFAYVPTGSLILHIAMPLCVAGVLIVCLKLRKGKAFIASALCSVFILLSVSFINNLFYMNKLQITVLNESNSCAIVLNMNGQTCIIDMYGGEKSSRLADSFLSKNSITRVDALVLTEKSQKSMSSYINNLSVPVNCVYFYENSNVVLSNNLKMTTFYDNEAMKMGIIKVLRCGRKEFLITYNDFTFAVNGQKQDNNCLILDTKDGISLSKGDNKYFYKDSKNAESFYISVCDNSSYKVRRMRDGLRQ